MMQLLPDFRKAIYYIKKTLYQKAVLTLTSIKLINHSFSDQN